VPRIFYRSAILCFVSGIVQRWFSKCFVPFSLADAGDDSLQFPAQSGLTRPFAAHIQSKNALLQQFRVTLWEAVAGCTPLCLSITYRLLFELTDYVTSVPKLKLQHVTGCQEGEHTCRVVCAAPLCTRLQEKGCAYMKLLFKNNTYILVSYTFPKALFSCCLNKSGSGFCNREAY